jgi:polyferredoxin
MGNKAVYIITFLIILLIFLICGWLFGVTLLSNLTQALKTKNKRDEEVNDIPQHIFVCQAG